MLNWSSAEPGIQKWKSYETHMNLPSRLSSQTEWMQKEETPEGGHQDTYPYTEGVKSFNNQVGGSKIDAPPCADHLKRLQLSPMVLMFQGKTVLL